MSAFAEPLPPSSPVSGGQSRPAVLTASLHSRLPKIWIGYALTLTVFALSALSLQDPGDFTGPAINVNVSSAALVLYLIAWVYWLFCVHRIHRVLKEATSGSYPISPRVAVGFQFIPIYSLIWGYKWTNRIAEFVNGRDNSPLMSKYLPGSVLLVAAFIGQVGILGSLHLLLLFGTGHYIIRKLRPLLPPLAKTALIQRQEHQLHMAVSAGIGAVFTLKLFRAFQNPMNYNRNEFFHDIVVITLVSLGVILFIEPLAQVWRRRIGFEEHHAQLIGVLPGGPWNVKIAAFTILAITSLFHGFLHKEIDREMTTDAVRTLVGIAGATLISGGITYAWVSGARRTKPRAARFGLITGATVGLFVISIILPITKLQTPKPKDPTTLEQDVRRGVGEVSQLINAIESYRDPNVRAEWVFYLGRTILPWTLLGLIGGLAVDRRWGRTPSRNVGIAVFLAGTLLYPALGSLAVWFPQVKDYAPTDVAAHILAVGGWAVSLAIFPFADKLLDIHPATSSTLSEVGIDQHPAA